MSKFEIKGLTFTTLDQTIRFINQLREIGDQLKGSIFGVPMGVNTKGLNHQNTTIGDQEVMG